MESCCRDLSAKTKGPQACRHLQANKPKRTGEKDDCCQCRLLSQICRYSAGPRQGQGQAVDRNGSSSETASIAAYEILMAPSYSHTRMINHNN
ncbi:hypothetical protein HD806DRAFT_256074 [Xylariaceae sp. AK1471]|nr:hypothetical protein HD806DRAFT_256074 [Xylariaceae sp. AK1471]